MVQLLHPRQTPRLTLRRFQIDDLDDLALIVGNDDVNRYLYSEPRDMEATTVMLQGLLDLPEETGDDNRLCVAVELGGEKRVIGEFLLWWTKNEHRQGEMGGSLHPDFHGRGFASEVYAELLDLAFSDYGLHRVVGRCDARNLPSVRSLDKVGMREEARFVENEWVKGEWTDEIVMAIRKEEWDRRR
ncbi:MAG TPA: GNAT family protein [Acidimicrobiales bacterium]|jgi:RimJ/RimL family protein N-acetyltransferase|nr:GNAT family protein [Acidimicrobiales bacterium]